MSLPPPVGDLRPIYQPPYPWPADNTRLEWQITKDERTCPTCNALRGHVATVATWRSLGLYPGSPLLICQEHCRCRLVTTDRPVTLYDTTAIPIIMLPDEPEDPEQPEENAMPRQAVRLALQGTITPTSDPANFAARFIAVGPLRGGNGRPTRRTVTASSLQDAAARGLFDARAVFLDHGNPPSLDRLAGITEDAIFDGAAIAGRIRLYDTATGQTARQIVGAVLDELTAGRTPPDVGISLSLWATWDGDQLTRIEDVESVDLVFRPAADLARITGLSTAEENQNVNEDTPAQAFEQELDAHRAAGSAAAQAWSAALATTAANALISASGLPMPIRERLSAQAYTDPQQVTDAITSARAELAALQSANIITGHGYAPRGGHITGMRTGLDALTLAFDALMAGTTPADVAPLSGIREAYVALSGDYEMTGRFNPERVQLAAVDSSTMANMVANVLNKRLNNAWQDYPKWWEPISTPEDFASLQAIKWITLGGVGELPTVAEGAAYTELTWDDSAEAGTWVKKGGYLGLTLEAMDKDDVGRLRAAPRALAQSAWLTLSKAVSGIFTTASGVGPTLADTGALFNATAVTSAGGHANLGTTALSLTTWLAARLAMRKQTELNSGERLGGLTTPKYLLVPPDLENTALVVLGSELLPGSPNNDINAESQGNTHDALLMNARNRVIVVDLWTDTNNWAAVADPMMYPTIGIGYRFGRTPEVFSVASPTAGLMFSNDVMPVKVRFFFAVGPMDYRGLYKANVAGG